MQKRPEQERIRIEKLDYLVEKGIKPFGQRFDRTHNAKTIVEDYDQFDKEQLEEKQLPAVIAGRIIQKRRQGKIGFIDILDKFGTTQVYLSKEVLGEENYDVFIKSDLGDIVGIKGVMMRTNTGQLTVKCLEFVHLSKAIRPLPDKFHGLQDLEEARRRRYVDLIVNEESRKVAFMRPRIIRAIQHFFDGLGFVEVETPVLQPILGGASARPFETHHNALDMPFYLRIATELHLKRLIVGGMEAVYEIGRLFRNEGVDARHNPEFTTVEAYLAYSDMEGMMDLIENFFKSVTMEVLGTTVVEFNGVTYDLGNIQRKHMVDIVKEQSGVDFWNEMTFDEAKAIAKEHHIDVPAHFTGIGHIINAFFEKYGEETLEQPTLVYGHPVEISPLAKTNDKDPRFTDRFELFIGGTEYCNAFSELNDPLDQMARFQKQLEERNLGNDEACEIDIDFVEALEYGMPPCGGIGIGIDRLIMLLTGKTNIRDILLFPHNRNRADK
ncbi:MAG: lysine--tRNA ligase [Acholeplasmatales bacterium]|nr:lysine--tRNA ligase [Acholeplasmatales bacterium]